MVSDERLSRADKERGRKKEFQNFSKYSKNRQDSVSFVDTPSVLAEFHRHTSKEVGKFRRHTSEEVGEFHR